VDLIVIAAEGMSEMTPEALTRFAPGTLLKILPRLFDVCSCNNSWVPHISLVFREMWDNRELLQG
jgi:hypothetical protein